MEIERILQNRVNRGTRAGRPYLVFESASAECLDAAQFLLSTPNSKYARLLERAVVISMVSAVEVYFKDVLDGIFRLCAPAFFEPHLKRLHATKYDISELVDFHRNGVHPLELIAANQSFQNTEVIESVFSKFLGKSLWGSVLDMKVRVKDAPETEYQFEAKLLSDLKKLFSLRHELVHDPSQKPVFSSVVRDQIQSVSVLILGVDIALMKMIAENQDPDLKTNA